MTGRRRNRRSAAQEDELSIIEQAAQGSPPAQRESREDRLIEHLIDRLDRLQPVAAPRHEFKPPNYEGETDVELFLTQFQDIVRANRWTPEEALLHLRSCLKGDAADCGRETNLQDVYESLRTRFSLTPKQAREQLQTLRKIAKQSYDELGAEVSRLVRMAYAAYAGQSLQFRTQTMLEGPANRPTLAQVDAEDYQPTVAQTTPALTPITEVVTLLKEVMQKRHRLREMMHDRMKNPPPPAPPRRFGPCYHCQGDHLKRNCPHQRSIKVHQAATRTAGTEKQLTRPSTSCVTKPTALTQSPRSFKTATSLAGIDEERLTPQCSHLRPLHATGSFSVVTDQQADGGLTDSSSTSTAQTLTAVETSSAPEVPAHLPSSDQQAAVDSDLQQTRQSTALRSENHNIRSTLPMRTIQTELTMGNQLDDNCGVITATPIVTTHNAPGLSEHYKNAYPYTVSTGGAMDDVASMTHAQSNLNAKLCQPQPPTTLSNSDERVEVHCRSVSTPWREEVKDTKTRPQRRATRMGEEPLQTRELDHGSCKLDNALVESGLCVKGQVLSASDRKQTHLHVIKVYPNHSYQLQLEGKTFREKCDYVSPVMSGWGPAPQRGEGTSQPPELGPRSSHSQPSSLGDEEESPNAPPVEESSPSQLPVSLTGHASTEPAVPTQPVWESETCLTVANEEASSSPANHEVPRQRTQTESTQSQSVQYMDDGFFPPRRCNQRANQMGIRRPAVLSNCHSTLTARKETQLALLTMPHHSEDPDIRRLHEELGLVMSDSEDNVSLEEGEVQSPVTTPPQPPANNRPRIRRVERSTNGRLPFSTTRDKYVHTQTEALALHVERKLRAKVNCPVCNQKIRGGDTRLHHHAWDHLLVYVCACGTILHTYEDSDRHTTHEHPGMAYNCERIDQLYYQEARFALPHLNLGAEYPGVIHNYDLFLPRPVSRTFSNLETTRRDLIPREIATPTQERRRAPGAIPIRERLQPRPAPISCHQILLPRPRNLPTTTSRTDEKSLQPVCSSRRPTLRPAATIVAPLPEMTPAPAVSSDEKARPTYPLRRPTGRSAAPVLALPAGENPPTATSPAILSRLGPDRRRTRRPTTTEIAPPPETLPPPPDFSTYSTREIHSMLNTELVSAARFDLLQTECRDNCYKMLQELRRRDQAPPVKP